MNVQEKKAPSPDDLPLPPPLGWDLHYSTSHQKYYYFHRETSHRQWTCPTKSEFDDPIAAKKKRDDAEEEREKRRAATRQRREEEAIDGSYAKIASQPSKGKSSLSTEDPPIAPPGWRRYFSTKSRQHYYVHQASNHSQWTYPTESEVADPIAAKKKRDYAEAEKEKAERRRREEEAKEELRQQEEEDHDAQLQQRYLAAIQRGKEEEDARRQLVAQRLPSVDAACKQILASAEHEFTGETFFCVGFIASSLHLYHFVLISSCFCQRPCVELVPCERRSVDNECASSAPSFAKETKYIDVQRSYDIVIKERNEVDLCSNAHGESVQSGFSAWLDKFDMDISDDESVQSGFSTWLVELEFDTSSLLVSSTDQSTSSPTQSQSFIEEDFDIMNMPFTRMSRTKQGCCENDSCHEYVESEVYFESEGYFESGGYVESEDESPVISPSPVMDTPASNSSIPPNGKLCLPCSLFVLANMCA